MASHLNRAAILALALGLSLAGCKKEPAPAPTESAAPSEEAVVAEQTPEEWIRANYKDLGEVRYAKAEADLDGDGSPEVLVYVGGSLLCGTGGCNLEVLKREGGELKRVSDISVVQLPVGVLDSKTNGWRDLAVSVSGGGVQSATMKLPFDGKTYADNPTVAPAAPVESIGKTLIPAEDLKPLG
ncbi:hypothetical protein WSK_2426 [Novosphingobium sp. Rr 2-17]|uniref:hypothetical protein n=1 Tax=Novosphingobium sp. Rr 2-17 TaxID=555793 RepID=UPI000269A826|nr:hypothetical protein [Novosphingobium sp. Rr 2-17]EIZ78883.1 hypothetical protein WSK_2426 [Novosphingobium sp. Rr 2-17]